MTAPAAPEADCEQQHPSLAVTDVRAAAEFYTTALGFRGASPRCCGISRRSST
jgi:hypothetical protein